jgi:DNA polymerase I-like protein with 3'-5' exonuclease and polymerase domains
MNFGVFYRQSAETFLEKHEIPVKEAEKYIDWVWSTFTGVKQWEAEVEQLVHKNKHRDYTYIESPFGHRRRFYLITDANRNAVYREAINFLPQNLAANCTLHACAQIHREIDPLRARLCLTVHDSILAQVKEDYVEEYATICEQIMVAVPKDKLGWDLPFEVETGVGKTWAKAK